MNGAIIYLEDDDMLAFVTKRSLEKKGFQVHHYATTDDFRHGLANLEFDYALLDLKIGNDTSLTLIQQIKGVKDVPVVILTGYGTIQTAVQAMKLGAINFISKPSTVDEIIHALHEKGDHEQPQRTEIKIEKPSLKSVEWETIQRAIDENQGNLSAAARQLKMHRRTLQRKLNKRHIQ